MKKLLILKTEPSYVIERKSFDNKIHIVAPAIILKEGVHHAANAEVPYYYPGDVLSHVPEIWNHTPVLVNHPDSGITANTIDMHEKEVVGGLWNTKYEDGLKTEIWLDEEKLKTKNPELYQKISNGEAIEVSTGVWLDLIEEEGVWEGESYGAKVTNMWSDHLAILPSAKGACSIDDGCGIRNEGAKNMDKIEQEGFIARIIEGVKSLVTNNKEDCNCKNHPEEPGTEVIQMDREKVITALIANGTYKEEDREELKKLDEKHLSKLAKLTETPPPAETAAEVKEPEKEAPAVEAKKEDDKPQTEEEYINAAPPGVREVLEEGLNMRKQKKDSIITALTANTNCKFTKEQLEKKPITELEALAELARVEVDYSLQAGGKADNEDSVPAPPPLFMVKKAANG